MKTIIISFIAILFLAMPAQSQLTASVGGVEITYDTTGQFALTTLVGSKGYLKYVGTIDMKQGTALIDSMSLWVSFSDSVTVSFFVRPKSLYKPSAQTDTTGRASPAGLHLAHIQLGAGHVSIPWYRMTGVSDLTRKSSQMDVYVWITKVAGLTTYGTASAGKAVQKMRIIAQRHY